mgnify:CR=1 FL=1
MGVSIGIHWEGVTWRCDLSKICPTARWAGARVVTALEHNLLLGRRGAGNQKVGLSWDARAAIALAAQLLAEAQQPLLAGELWKEVQSLLAYSAEEGADLDLFRRQTSEMLGVGGVAALEPVIEFLKDNNSIAVEVVGHCDATGNERRNDPLSLQRAQSFAKRGSARSSG